MIIDRKIDIVYVGIVSEVRLIHNILDAIKDLNVTFHIAGSFDSIKYETKIKNHPSFNKVKLYGYLESDAVINLIDKSDFCLLPLKNIETYQTSLPVKLFEYMRQGRFVIAQNFKTISNIINKHDCGMLINFENTNEIIEALNYSFQNLTNIKKKGLLGIDAIRTEYNWNREFIRLDKFYNDTYLKKNKNINKNRFQNLSSFFSLSFFLHLASKIASNKKLFFIYLAAVISFLTTLLRDFYIINYTSFSQIFFIILYITSIASSFSINAITLNSDQSRLGNILVLCFLSFFIIYFLFRYHAELLLGYQINFFYLYSIILFWIIGSMFGRHILDMNLNFFIARSREALSSIIFLFLIFFGINLFVSFLVAVAIGTLSLLVYLIINKKNYISNLFINFTKNLNISKILFTNILFSNLSILLIYLWALYFSGIEAYYFDISSVTLSRLSVYLFQIITLGSVYFSLGVNLITSSLTIYIKYSFYFFLVLALITYQSIFHFIFFPIAISMLHYYFVSRLILFRE